MKHLTRKQKIFLHNMFAIERKNVMYLCTAAEIKEFRRLRMIAFGSIPRRKRIKARRRWLKQMQPFFEMLRDMAGGT